MPEFSPSPFTLHSSCSTKFAKSPVVSICPGPFVTCSSPSFVTSNLHFSARSVFQPCKIVAVEERLQSQSAAAECCETRPALRAIAGRCGRCRVGFGSVYSRIRSPSSATANMPPVDRRRSNVCHCVGVAGISSAANRAFLPSHEAAGRKRIVRRRDVQFITIIGRIGRVERRSQKHAAVRFAAAL